LRTTPCFKFAKFLRPENTNGTFFIDPPQYGVDEFHMDATTLQSKLDDAGDLMVSVAEFDQAALKREASSLHFRNRRGNRHASAFRR
jgi:hypothetical protein